MKYKIKLLVLLSRKLHSVQIWVLAECLFNQEDKIVFFSSEESFDENSKNSYFRFQNELPQSSPPGVTPKSCVFTTIFTEPL